MPPRFYNTLLFSLLLPLSLVAQQNIAGAFLKMNDGTNLFYKIFGNRGDTIIMLHGGPGQNMYGIGPDLEPLALNHVLLMYDQRGSGNSEAGPDTITANKHIADLENIRQHFGIQKMILVGQSWGTMLASLYTSSFPQYVTRLLFISPGPPTRKLFDARFIAFARKDGAGQTRVRQLRSQLNGPDALAVCREIFYINEHFYFADSSAMKRKKGNYCSVSPDVLRKQALTASTTLRSLGDYDLRSACATIKQPVLLVEGALSPVPAEEMEYWKNSLPNSKVYLFPKSGHGYSFVEEPELFFRIAEDFFRGKWPGK